MRESKRTERTSGFVDGNDLCEGCTRCCDPLDGLLVTDEELDRLPLLRPFVVDTDGHLSTIVVDGPCPYLGDDGWCTTFETRPFDCSLFPAQVGGIRRDPGRASATVVWRYGGEECPRRSEFMSQGASEEQLDQLRRYAERATGAGQVELRLDRTPLTVRRMRRVAGRALRLFRRR
ncbi:MAG TPA: YkgJ family cysteine cluster protein [Acidimicrobiales bacterium]|nr:YkgJ family cysteine cluster protein [Acidimicrobiales bacterium]